MTTLKRKQTSRNISKKIASQYINREITKKEFLVISEIDYIVKSIKKDGMKVHYIYVASELDQFQMQPSIIVFEKTKDILLYRRFIKKTYNTSTHRYDDVFKASWSTARLSSVFSIYDEGVYVGSKSKDAYDLLNEIDARQQYLQKSKALEQKEKKQAAIINTMKRVPSLPKSFDAWVKKTAFKDYNYIFYTPSSKKAKIKGHCSCCNKEIELSAVTHNQTVKCPNCKVVATAKSLNRTKYLSDWTYFYILQKVGSSILIRSFFGYKHYSNGFKTSNINYFEEIREFIHKDGSIDVYESSSHNTSSPSDWHKNIKYTYFGKNSKVNSLHTGSCYVYSRNLSSVIKNTVWQYSGLVEFMKMENFKERPIRYLSSFVKFPVQEQFVKLGLSNLVFDFPATEYFKSLYYSYRMRDIYGNAYYRERTYDSTMLNTEATNIYDAVMIEKRWLKQIKVINPTLPELIGYKDIIKKYSFTDSKGVLVEPALDVNDISIVLKAIASNHSRYSVTSEYLDVLIENGISFKKTVNYLRRQFKILNVAKTRTFHDILIFWKDYLKMAKELENLAIRKGSPISEFPLFPKDIEKMHDQVNELYSDSQFDINNEKLKELNPTWSKYEYSGKKYSVIPPKDSFDLLNESNVLKHCVKGYAKRIAKKETLVLFVRDNENLETPLYTMEINEDSLGIRQLRGFKNCDAPDAVYSFIDEWRSVVEQRVNEPSIFDSQWNNLRAKELMKQRKALTCTEIA